MGWIIPFGASLVVLGALLVVSGASHALAYAFFGAFLLTGLLRGLQFLDKETDQTRYKELVELRHQVEAFMENNPAVAFVKDHRFRYRFINKAYESLFQVRVQDVLGREDADIMTREVAHRLRANDERVLTSGNTENLIEVVPDAQGTIRHWMVTKFPFQGGDGQTWLGGLAFDITELVQAKKELESSKNLYSSLVDNLPMAVFRKDLEGHILFGNEYYLKAIGRSRAEIDHLTDTDLFSESELQTVRQDDSGIIKEGNQLRTRRSFSNRDGVRREVELLKIPIRDANGKVVAIQGAFWDITERANEESRRQENLVRSQKQNAALAELINQPQFLESGFAQAARKVATTASNTLQVSRVGVWLFNEMGTELQLVTLVQDGKEIPPDFTSVQARDYPSYFKALKSSLSIDAHDARNDPRTLEFKDDYLIPNDIHSLLDSAIRVQGKIRGIICNEQRTGCRTWLDDETKFSSLLADQLAQALVFDERRRKELALKESEERFRELAETIEEVFWVADAKTGKFQYVSPAAASIWGPKPFPKSREELATRVHEADQELFNATWVRLRRGTNAGIEYRLLGSDGMERMVWDRAFPVQGPDGHVDRIHGITMDLTDQKQAEEALDQAMQRQLLHVQQTPLGVVEWDLEFRVTAWNHMAEQIFGWSSEEALGREGTFIVPTESRTSIHDTWENLVIGSGGRRSRNANVTKDGRHIICEWYNTALKDARGRILGVASLVLDVTREEEAERDRLRMEEKLRETAKLESLGVLAGGIAHDFNNLLTSILGNASLVTRQIPPGSSGHKQLEQIAQSTRRAAELCQQMLAYSGKGKFVVKPIHMTSFVEETLQLIETSISKKARLQTEFTEALPLIQADTNQLRQIVMNLVLNASEALEDHSGKITIKTGSMVPDADFLKDCHLAPVLPPGQYVFLEVTDSGCGMDKETLNKIFDPFFTTKFTGRGLGLAAVQGIIRGHRGAMKVTSEPGAGTTFRILFPACNEKAENVTQLQSSVGEQFSSWGRALLADDEDSVRNVTQLMLETIGFDVIPASNGAEALELFQKHNNDFRLILLDLTMPELDGVEVLQELRKLVPDVKVIMMSGFNKENTLGRFSDQGLAGFIQKPFRLEDLRSKIKEVLSKESQGQGEGI